MALRHGAVPMVRRKGLHEVAGIQGIAMRESPALRPAERSRAFRKARRHSRWVRFAKVAIPLGALWAWPVSAWSPISIRSGRSRT